MEPAIYAKEVVKSYGKIKALDRLSLKVEEGEIYCLVGPNGAGKTTFVKCSLGILKVDSGEIKLLGKRMPNKDALSKIGYMPQEISLYQDLTVEENLYFFSRMYGLNGEEAKSRIEEILSLIKLEEWREILTVNLSGGMQRRLSLGISLLPRPKLLILDEPTVGIDPALRSEFWRHFRELSGQGVTIFITTHYMEEAKRCDSVGMIRGGKIIAEGPPKEIIKRTMAKSLEEAFLRILGELV